MISFQPKELECLLSIRNDVKNYVKQPESNLTRYGGTLTRMKDWHLDDSNISSKSSDIRSLLSSYAEANSMTSFTKRNSTAASESQLRLMSKTEQTLLNSTQPLDLNQSDVVEMKGLRGILVNKDEVQNWKGDIPIEEYPLNLDESPDLILKKTNSSLKYVQQMAIRYLKPPTPPKPGEIVIRQEPNILTAPAPPLIIRQQQTRGKTPEPLVIREMPPNEPKPVGRKLITISGKKLPPPPRKVIVER